MKNIWITEKYKENVSAYLSKAEKEIWSSMAAGKYKLGLNDRRGAEEDTEKDTEKT